MQQSDAIEILNETHHRYQSVFSCKIQKAYLYGSYARGDFDSESDVDILLEELSAYRNSITAISSDLSLAYDVTSIHSGKTFGTIPQIRIRAALL